MEVLLVIFQCLISNGGRSSSLGVQKVVWGEMNGCFFHFSCKPVPCQGPSLVSAHSGSPRSGGESQVLHGFNDKAASEIRGRKRRGNA